MMQTSPGPIQQKYMSTLFDRQNYLKRPHQQMHTSWVQPNNCQKYTIVQHYDGCAEEVETIKSRQEGLGKKV
jgi:hypothetical protein